MLLLLLARAEEEHFVLHDRTAERSAKLLPAERRLRAVALLREVVLRRQLPVALVAEHRAVELVGARLGDKRDRRAARTSVGGRELVGRELERLEAFSREAHERSAVVVVAVVGAVDRGLDVAARRSAVRHRSDGLLRSVERGDGRRPRQQLEHAADGPRNHRQVLQFGGLNGVGNLRLRRLDERRLTGDGERLVEAGQRQFEIDRDRRVDAQSDVVTQRLRETGQLRLDLIGAWLEAGQEILSFSVGHARADHAGGRVGNRHGYTWKDGVAVVDDAAVERACCLRVSQ